MSESYEKFIYRRSWTASVFVAIRLNRQAVSVERRRISAFVPPSEPAKLILEPNQFAGQELDTQPTRTKANESGKTVAQLLIERNEPDFSGRITAWKLVCECPCEVTRILYCDKDDKEFKNGENYSLDSGAVMGSIIVPKDTYVVFVVNRDKCFGGKNEK